MSDVKLSNIWYDSKNKEIRVDWDNDRHFAAKLNHEDYNDVGRALHLLIKMIYKEEMENAID